MSREITPGPIVGGGNCIKEAVCIHTDKVYDSCRDKECLEDLRVYFPVCYQSIVDDAINVKITDCEIIWVHTNVEPMSFNQGNYSIDIRFFFKVTLDAYTDMIRPRRIEGLATYDKKVVLFGSEGKAKIYQSLYQYQADDRQLLTKNNLPKAVVEVVDPVPLGAKIVEKCSCSRPCCELYDISSAPSFICNCFEDVFADPDTEKRVYVSLGLFSITKLERNVQLLIPVYDFCVPADECVQSSPSNPCELFDTIQFPVDEFYPPQKHDFNNNNNNNTNSSGRC